MECNKDEAVRARGIAEQKMQNGDFEGAKKFALKAQKMFPELENISKLLTTCDVHHCAKHKLYGSEMDWYGILQIGQLADESSIKKQYKKLALLLHPDKNKFAGAEAAFKLIGEAKRTLTDKRARSQYDKKCNNSGKTAPEATSHQPNGASSVNSQYEFTNNNQNGSSKSTASNSYQQAQHQTFWTLCPACGSRCHYCKDLLNKSLRCPTCGFFFIACDWGPQGYFWSQFSYQKEAPNQDPSKVSSLCNGGNPSGNHFPHRFAGPAPIPKAGSSVQAGDSKKEAKVGVQMIQPHEGSKAQQKVDRFSNARDRNKGAEMPKPNAAKLKGARTSRNGGLNSNVNAGHKELKQKPSAPEYTIPNKRSRIEESKRKDSLSQEKATNEPIGTLKSTLDAATKKCPSMLEKQIMNQGFSAAAPTPPVQSKVQGFGVNSYTAHVPTFNNPNIRSALQRGLGVHRNQI